MSRTDPWATLGVERGAPVDEVRKSYRELLALYHPDRHAGSPDHILDRAAERTRAITEAWEAIRDGNTGEDATGPNGSGAASTPARPADARGHAGLERCGRLWLPPEEVAPIASSGRENFRLDSRALPPAPDPHPNIFWVDLPKPEAIARLRVLAKALGLKRQPKASADLLMFTRGVFSATGVVVTVTSLSPTVSEVRIKGARMVEHELRGFMDGVRANPAIFD